MWTQNHVNRCARYTLLQVIVIMIIMIIEFLEVKMYKEIYKRKNAKFVKDIVVLPHFPILV